MVDQGSIQNYLKFLLDNNHNEIAKIAGWKGSDGLYSQQTVDFIHSRIKELEVEKDEKVAEHRRIGDNNPSGKAVLNVQIYALDNLIDELEGLIDEHHSTRKKYIVKAKLRDREIGLNRRNRFKSHKRRKSRAKSRKRRKSRAKSRAKSRKGHRSRRTIPQHKKDVNLLFYGKSYFQGVMKNKYGKFNRALKKLTKKFSPNIAKRVTGQSGAYGEQHLFKVQPGNVSEFKKEAKKIFGKIKNLHISFDLKKSLKYLDKEK